MDYVNDIATLLDSIKQHYEAGIESAKSGISTIKNARPYSGRIGVKVKARRPQYDEVGFFTQDNCMVLEDLQGKRIGNITIDKRQGITQVRVRMFGEMRASRFHESDKTDVLMQELQQLLDYFCLIVV